MAVTAGTKLYERDPRACSFCAFVLLSLLGISLFSRRSLEPAVSSFTDKLLLGTLPNSSLIQSNKTQYDTDHDSIEKTEISESGVPKIEVLDREGDREDVDEMGKCDLYDGSWEEDKEGRYPLYMPGSCPYVDDAFTCQENGRPDDGYLKWRWKPRGCDLPR